MHDSEIKQLGKIRCAGITTSLRAALKFLKNQPEFEKYINGEKEEEEVEVDEIGELIWNDLVTSGMSRKVARSIGHSFERITGHTIVPEHLEKEQNCGFGKDAFAEKYPFLPLVPISNGNGHSYRVGEVVILNRVGSRRHAFSYNQGASYLRTGNWLEPWTVTAFALPSIATLLRFFNPSRTSGLTSEGVRKLYGRTQCDTLSKNFPDNAIETVREYEGILSIANENPDFPLQIK